MGRRWNVLVVAGIACFLVGVANVVLLARDDGSSPSSRPASDTVPVLVAKEDIKSGTTGAEAATKVEVQHVSIAARAADALSSPSELSTQLVVAAFSKGEQIRQGGLKRQTCLACAARPGKRDEAMLIQQAGDFLQLLLSPDEAGDVRRQIAAWDARVRDHGGLPTE